MNIGEANAVNVVLRTVINDRRHEQEQFEDLLNMPPELIEAAVLLADQANKVLHAGLTGDQVREALS